MDEGKEQTGNILLPKGSVDDHVVTLPSKPLVPKSSVQTPDNRARDRQIVREIVGGHTPLQIGEKEGGLVIVQKPNEVIEANLPPSSAQKRGEISLPFEVGSKLLTGEIGEAVLLQLKKEEFREND